MILFINGEFNWKFFGLEQSFEMVNPPIRILNNMIIFKIQIYINTFSAQEFNNQYLNDIYCKGDIIYLFNQAKYNQNFSNQGFELYEIKTIGDLAQRYDNIYNYIDKNANKFKSQINNYKCDIFNVQNDQDQEFLIEKQKYFTSQLAQKQVKIDQEIDESFFTQQQDILLHMYVLELIFFKKSMFKRLLQNLINIYYLYQFICIIVIFVYEIALIDQFTAIKEYSRFDKYQCICFLLINSVNFKNILNDYLAYIIIGFYFNLLGKNDQLQKKQLYLGFRQQFYFVNMITGGAKYKELYKFNFMDFYPQFFNQFIYLTLLIPFFLTHIMPAFLIFLPMTLAFSIMFYILGKIQDTYQFKKGVKKQIYTLVSILIGVLIIMMVAYQINLIIYYYMGFTWKQSFKQSFQLINANNFGKIMFNNEKPYDFASKALSILRAIF